MTQATQKFATAGQFNSKLRSGYGHYDISVTIYTNTDQPIDYIFTTTNVNLIDQLTDDDSYVAKQQLIDDACEYYGVEKTDDFEYIY